MRIKYEVFCYLGGELVHTECFSTFKQAFSYEQNWYLDYYGCYPYCEISSTQIPEGEIDE